MSLGFVIIVLDLIGLLAANPGWPWLGALNEDGFVQLGQANSMTVMLTYNVCVGTCHHSSFVVLSSCKSQAHTHTHTKKCFSLSPCVEERWHLNCHWGEGKVVSQGSRGQPLCWMVFEWLQNKSYRDEISCCCHAMVWVSALDMKCHHTSTTCPYNSMSKSRLSDTTAFSFSNLEKACNVHKRKHFSALKWERMKKIRDCMSSCITQLSFICFNKANNWYQRHFF